MQPYLNFSELRRFLHLCDQLTGEHAERYFKITRRWRKRSRPRYPYARRREAHIPRDPRS